MFKQVKSKKFSDFLDHISLIDPKETTDSEIFSIFQSKDFQKYKEDKATIEDFYKYIGRPLTKKRKSIIEAETYHYDMRVKFSRGMNRPAVQELLGVSEKVYKKLLEKNIIEPYRYQSFNKYGKSFDAPMYKYDDIISIDRENIEKVIASIEGSNDDKKAITQLENQLKEEFIFSFKKKWYTLVPVFKNKNILVRVPLSINPIFDKNFKENAINKLKDSRAKAMKHSSVNKLRKEIEETFLYNINVNYNKQFLENLEKDYIGLDLFKLTPSYVLELCNRTRSVMEIKFPDVLSEEEKENAFNQINEHYHDYSYPSIYKEARKRKRHFHIIEGETNSGKTYDAINALMKSESGAYLGPLRLLALEVHDKLNNSKIPCNLITGEEQFFIEKANHVSSTIETLDTKRYYETVVIDEMQMFCDIERGSSWVRAIVGANADNIYLIGSPLATKSVIKLIESLGDTYTISTKNRKSKLNVLNKQLNYSELEKGDAVVAFSKIDVLRYATILREHGFKVSTIYGNMPPEVKRSESKKFNSGKSDILVATDAIGMGLNLPIKRVIFGAGKKYDGFEYRELFPSEIKQIAGRAGRGSEDGHVGIIKEKHNETFSNSHIRKGLEVEQYGVCSQFMIAPEIETIKEISSIMNTDSLYLIYKIYLMIKSDSVLKPYINSNILSKAKHLDQHFSDLDVKFKLSLMPFKGNLYEDFVSLTDGKRHILENNDIFESCYDNPNEVEKLYHFLILYKSLNRIDSDLWSYRINMDVHIDDVICDLKHISEHQYSNYFSKNIEECI